MVGAYTPWINGGWGSDSQGQSGSGGGEICGLRVSGVVRVAIFRVWEDSTKKPYGRGVKGGGMSAWDG